MNLFIAGLILDTIGKVFIGVAVLMVHHSMFKEHKIEIHVLKAMRKEWSFTLIGILLIIIGALMQLVFHL